MAFLYLHLIWLLVAKVGLSLCINFVTLKCKQLAIAIEIPMIFLSPSNESLVEFPSVNSIEKVVEVLDQNLSPPQINNLGL
jgi:hypothetical protein